MSIQGSSLFAEQFEELSGYTLLSRILSDKKCEIGPFTLRCVFKYSCSHDVIDYNQEKKAFSYTAASSSTKKDVLITDPKMLNLLVRSFRNISTRLDPAVSKMFNATYVCEIFVQAVNRVLLGQHGGSSWNSQIIRDLEMAKNIVFDIFGETLDDEAEFDSPSDVNLPEFPKPTTRDQIYKDYLEESKKLGKDPIDLRSIVDGLSSTPFKERSDSVSKSGEIDDEPAVYPAPKEGKQR